MNCANHSDQPAVAFCQFCGKPLCAACVRTIHNIVGCEPCLAARLAPAPSSYSASPYGSAAAYGAAPAPGAPNPVLAAILGLIPGVGAMYNGQFAKGLLHVLVFIMLIDLSHWNGLLGIGIAGWFFYQIFDAYHTALARRDGLPLPNPLGINDIGKWFSGHPSGDQTPQTPSPIPPAAPFAAAPAASAAPGAAPIPPVMPHPWWDDPYDCALPRSTSSIPGRAVVLIVLGVLFLLGNFGILRGNWINHLFPIALIGLGAWLLIQRNRELPPPPPPGNNSNNNSGGQQ